MKEFKLNIQLENDAFADSALPEISRCLQSITTTLDSIDENTLNYYQNVLDINGNIVGRYAIKTIEDTES